MTDELYTKAAFDYLFIAYIMSLVEHAEGTVITTEIVLSNSERIKALLQGENAVSAVVMRDVPDGMHGQYRANIGAVHDRGLALFQALLAL